MTETDNKTRTKQKVDRPHFQKIPGNALRSGDTIDHDSRLMVIDSTDSDWLYFQGGGKLAKWEGRKFWRMVK